MHHAVFSLNTGLCASPDGAALIARLADERGYESLWVGEHVVLPDPQAPPSPMAPQDPMLDPVAILSFLAATTTRIRLGTGIIILSQRNPVVLAKQLASLDVLSKGRLIFGIGAGYLEPEMSAIGVPLAERGDRTDEALAVMSTLWYDEHPAHHGRFWSFRGVDAYPRPVQRPIPVVVGGHTPAAYKRAVRFGQGWYGFGLDEAGTQASLDGLAKAAQEVERPASLGTLEISVSPRGRLTPERYTAFADLGVDRIVALPRPGLDQSGWEQFLDENAP